MGSRPTRGGTRTATPRHRLPSVAAAWGCLGTRAARHAALGSGGPSRRLTGEPGYPDGHLDGPTHPEPGPDGRALVRRMPRARVPPHPLLSVCLTCLWDSTTGSFGSATRPRTLGTASALLPYPFSQPPSRLNPSLSPAFRWSMRAPVYSWFY